MKAESHFTWGIKDPNLPKNSQQKWRQHPNRFSVGTQILGEEDLWNPRGPASGQRCLRKGSPAGMPLLSSGARPGSLERILQDLTPWWDTEAPRPGRPPSRSSVVSTFRCASPPRYRFPWEGKGAAGKPQS